MQCSGSGTVLSYLLQSRIHIGINIWIRFQTLVYCSLKTVTKSWKTIVKQWYEKSCTVVQRFLNIF